MAKILMLLSSRPEPPHLHLAPLSGRIEGPDVLVQLPT